ncbi:MAG: hypothetical protein E7619_08915 [Ruminococcaceae bacterium]|nr:hypothetical protein [Oscillospiraceae bacterium]
MNGFDLSATLENAERALQYANRDYTMADWKYEKLREQIEEFQSVLTDDVDVCVALASFGTSMIMQVTDIGYQNPDMLYFYGYINGNQTQLIQHVSQLNFVLMAVKKEEPERPPRRIGFITDDEE